GRGQSAAADGARSGEHGVGDGASGGGGRERGRAAVPVEGGDGGEGDRLVGLVRRRRLGGLRRRVVVGIATLIRGDVAAPGRGRGQGGAADGAGPGQDRVGDGGAGAGRRGERGRAAVPGEVRDGGERDRLVGLVDG